MKKAKENEEMPSRKKSNKKYKVIDVIDGGTVFKGTKEECEEWIDGGFGYMIRAITNNI